MTIQDYYDITGESLTKTTDQTVESAHQFVDKVLRRSNYIVKDVTCKEHGDKLFRGTDGFSSKSCFKHNFLFIFKCLLSSIQNMSTLKMPFKKPTIFVVFV